MYNKKSDYALNRKNKEAIVCQNAAGEIIQITKDEFASEEEFTYWKEWSDEEYRQEYNAGQSQKRLQKKMLEQVEDNKCSLSVEQILLNDLAVKERKAFIEKIKSALTETQFRRLWLYYVEGMSEQQIALKEKTSQQAVSVCLIKALKKIQKIFKK